jgi:hypothetical protein
VVEKVTLPGIAAGLYTAERKILYVERDAF